MRVPYTYEMFPFRFASVNMTGLGSSVTIVIPRWTIFDGQSMEYIRPLDCIPVLSVSGWQFVYCHSEMRLALMGGLWNLFRVKRHDCHSEQSRRISFIYSIVFMRCFDADLRPYSTWRCFFVIPSRDLLDGQSWNLSKVHKESDPLERIA